MLRKLLIAAGAMALTAALVPASAQAAPEDTAGVVIFTGDAIVGSAAYNGAPGEGLCLPGMAAQGGQCVVTGEVEQPPNGWRFDVPGNQDVELPLGAGKLESSCHAYGRFGGQVVATTSAPGVDDGNCDIKADGITDVTFSDVGGNRIGGSCAFGSGHSAAGDTGTGNAPDTFGIDNVGTPGAVYTEWVTSAGSALPIVGWAEYNNQPAGYAGLVQVNASPQSPSGIPCVNEPATTFTVIGVVAAGEAVPDLSGAA